MIKIDDICESGLKQHFKKDNNDLVNTIPDEMQVYYCREFIKDFLKPCSKGHSSYHFKHAVENFYNEYISNGAFITAAVMEGCEIKQFNLTSLNALVMLDYNNEYKELMK